MDEKNLLFAVIVGHAYPQLINWLRKNNIEYNLYSHAYEPAIARNKAIIDFLDSNKSTLMMFDGDQIPTEDTKIFEYPDKPLVYCGYPSRNVKLKGHFGDGDFAAGCFRCDREVILAMQSKLDIINKQLFINNFHFSQALELGWFGRALYNYGSVETSCSCDWFNALAKSVGYETEMIGTIGHAISVTDILFLTKEHTSYATGKLFSK